MICMHSGYSVLVLYQELIIHQLLHEILKYIPGELRENYTVQLNLNLKVAGVCANVARYISNNTRDLLSSANYYFYNTFLVKIILHAKYSQAQSLLANTELSACIC